MQTSEAKRGPHGNPEIPGTKEKARVDAKPPASAANNGANNRNHPQSTAPPTSEHSYSGGEGGFDRLSVDGRAAVDSSGRITDAASSERRRSSSKSRSSNTVYGIPTTVTSSGAFPGVGSILGPYFCLGRLGKGTFSSIHKCINLQYYHQQHHPATDQKPSADMGSQQPNSSNNNRRHLAAAKVELGDFQQSGVLESEATMLDFLYRSLPPGTVPVYMGHYRSTKYAALFMEFLPGPDMHQLREKVMAISQQRKQLNPTGSSSYNTRRMSVKDAVVLTARIFLPLLQRMHQVGTVHRDVKPSNIVQSHLTSTKDKTASDFCLVDFGLSKSIIVPADSDLADREHLWPADAKWLKPLHYTGRAAYRRERERAEFRGTSMYASLRVHQLKDYCPRDDVWSLLYVFCDLISGGLPWMTLAANRDRAGCQKLKEQIHRENSPAEIARLLYGDEHYSALYKRERYVKDGAKPEFLPLVPQPLALSRDEFKVGRLREAFQHLSQLQFHDMPDYHLVQSCLEDFLRPSQFTDPEIAEIPWTGAFNNSILNRRHHGFPDWELQDGEAEFGEEIFDDAQKELNQLYNSTPFTRLPLYYQCYVAQMRQDVGHDVPPPRALRDWMNVVLRLLHKDWNSRKYEDGGHRTATDGFRRDRYLQLLKECAEFAGKHGNFQDQRYYNAFEGPNNETPRKKQKVVVHRVRPGLSQNPMVVVSHTLYTLRRAIKAEKAKKPPPPVRISFS